MQFRYLHHLLVLAVLAGVVSVAPVHGEAPAASWCSLMKITGYVRTEFSPWTADGTSIYTDEPIAAASWNIPLGSVVFVDGVGTFRVADRGMLGSAGWIDIATWSRAEAYSLTGTREVCVVPAEETTS